MRTLFRRLSLLFCILRYGARLIWLAAPQDHKLHWFATLIKGMHEASGARASLHRALPQLGPLASAFAESVGEHPELATHTLHDAIDAVSRLEAPLSPEQSAHRRNRPEQDGDRQSAKRVNFQAESSARIQLSAS